MFMADHDGTRVLGSWSQANSVLAQDAPLGVWETVSGAGRFYRDLHTPGGGGFMRHQPVGGALLLLSTSECRNPRVCSSHE
jgi:hypothetical protein